MQTTLRTLKVIFWLTTAGLVVFCCLFGIPVVSQIAAGKIIEIAGCTPPSFEMQAVCPIGSFAEPFVPLTHWFTSILAPLVLLKNFGGFLLGWAALCFTLFALLCVLPKQSTQ